MKNSIRRRADSGLSSECVAVVSSTAAAGHSSLQCCRHKLITGGGLKHSFFFFFASFPPSQFAIKLSFLCSFPLCLSFYFH